MSNAGVDAVVVAIPARDEADLLPACLASVLAALDHPTVAGLRAVVVVAADGCRDRTAEVVRAALADDERLVLVEGAWRAAGAARAAATEAGLDLVAAAPERTWIATTDADSMVPPDWLAEQLRLAADGWAAVAGIVRLGADEAAAVQAEFLRTYEVPAHGRHPHVHGANLGVRADAYQAVGGWAPVALAEDHATWRALVDDGYPVISSTSSWVWTSGRVEGRAAGGFADALARLTA